MWLGVLYIASLCLGIWLPTDTSDVEYGAYCEARPQDCPR